MSTLCKLSFTTVDVFTNVRFSGNPLAIVHLPLSAKLTQEQKQLIAREFNLAETVFLHEPDPMTTIFSIDTFTRSEELPFAGHPTVGTAWYLLSRDKGLANAAIRTKAGLIPISRSVSSGKAHIIVPTDFKIHHSYFHPGLKPFQSRLKPEDYVNAVDGPEPVVSIVKGMTFILLELATEDALSRLVHLPSRLTLPEGYLGDWEGPIVGLYAFVDRGDGLIRTRMFDGSYEDPATGSAASALAGWLAQKKGPGMWKLDIVQGVEMRQRSEIAISVDIGENGEVKSVQMEGGAVKVTEGWLEI